ncbi:MAG: hypothetical protein MN733_14665 [Nitrososphaera sp.]|nr:hypothetical protein [Nitrososphaera sp.]
MSEQKRIWQLKETGKWADDSGDKKTAISELSAHGENAVASLEEILNVTVYEEIRAACIEAIKTIREKEDKSGAQTEKKDEPEKSEGKKELILADLPP